MNDDKMRRIAPIFLRFIVLVQQIAGISVGSVGDRKIVIFGHSRLPGSKGPRPFAGTGGARKVLPPKFLKNCVQAPRRLRSRLVA